MCLSSLLVLRFVNPVTTAVQIQRRLESAVAGQPYAKRIRFVPLRRISEHLEHAVIAAEDGRFYLHRGIDWQELWNAMQANRRRGRFWRGGSTITQQLVKNLFLSTHGGVLRKIVELSLAPLAEAILPKQRILELYLNAVEWGPGVYGAEAAAAFHFGVPAASLSREQAARLAACLPAPLSRRPQDMDRYAAAILARMHRMEW